LEYNRKIDNKDDSEELFVKKLSEIIKKQSSFKTHIEQRDFLQRLEKASNKKFLMSISDGEFVFKLSPERILLLIFVCILLLIFFIQNYDINSFIKLPSIKPVNNIFRI